MADQMVDMKRAAPDENSGATAMPVDSSGGQYPWGLQIRLEDEDLDRLGIEDLPAVGTEIKGTFIGVVTETRQSVVDSSGSSMSIQICCIQLQAEDPEPAGQKEAESKESPGVYRSMGRPNSIVD